MRLLGQMHRAADCALSAFSNAILARRVLCIKMIAMGLAMIGTAQFCMDACMANGLQKNGRWFTYNGNYVYLVGVDAQQLAADPSLPYTEILDQFQKVRINKLRIWMDAYWNPAGYLHPWPYDLSSGRYNLDAWNPRYWDRLKDVISEALKRDIVVEISLFNGYPSDPSWWSGEFSVAWNGEFNVNGVFSTNDKGHFFPDFFDLTYSETSSSGKTLRDYQQALVDKAIFELGHYPNVYFEVMNEFFEFASDFDNGFEKVAPWQQFWADYLRQRTDRLVSVHVHDATNDRSVYTQGVEYFWDRPSVDVMTFHLYKTDPGLISDQLHASQDKNKILQNNESFQWYADKAVSPKRLDKVTREAWGWFASGGYYAFYNGQHTEYEGWDQLGTRAKVLRDVADKLSFWRMRPTDDEGNEYDALLLQGPTGKNRQLLANPGSEYMAYFWGEPKKALRVWPIRTDVIIQLPSGKYRYEWYDPRNGDQLAAGKVIGEGATTIQSPSPFLWSGSAGVSLLILKR